MKNKLILWSPAFALFIVDAVTLSIYPFVAEAVRPMVIIQIAACLCAAVALTLLADFSVVKIPVYLIAEIALQAALANNLGTAFDLYHIVPCWDLLLHGYFGFWCAQAIWLLIRGANVNAVIKYVLIFLCVMGVAALWEIFEFTTDLLFDGDAQRVQESIALGENPIIDTMTDIIIAAAGYAVFCVVRLVANLRVRTAKNPT